MAVVASCGQSNHFNGSLRLNAPLLISLKPVSLQHLVGLTDSDRPNQCGHHRCPLCHTGQLLGRL